MKHFTLQLLVAILFSFLATGQAVSQESKLSPEQIQDLLADKEIKGTLGGGEDWLKSHYADGSYVIKIPDFRGWLRKGSWNVSGAPESPFCFDRKFMNGDDDQRERCASIVQVGDNQYEMRIGDGRGKVWSFSVIGAGKKYQ